MKIIDSLQKQFITNAQGENIGVYLPIEEYNELLGRLEDLEDIKAVYEFKLNNEPTIPLHEAIHQRKQKHGIV